MVVDYKEKIAFSDEKANKVAISETDLSRTTLWCLQPGQHIHPHVHAGDHIWIVLEGEGRLLGVEGEPELAPGVTATLPSGEAHGVINSGSVGLVFLSISAGAS